MAHEKALELLSQTFGNRLIRCGSDLQLHGTSEAHFPVTPPDAITYVNSVEDVKNLIGICAKYECPVVAWGTGTSLEGHALALRGGVSADFSRMNRVLEINADDMTAIVEPGVTREALNAELRHTGLFFPVDPGANASLGGMAATRASGTTTVRYGTMHDNVLSLSVVLSDGRHIETGNQAPKSSAGYDLTSLFVGSEGTLGLITQLTLKLHPQPEAISAGIVAFDDVNSAVSAVIQTIQMGLPMARIEFVDAATTAAFNAYANAKMNEVPHLLFELHGSDRNVTDSAEVFNNICTDHGGRDFQWSSKTEQRTGLWALRHKAYYAILASRPGSTTMITDICVPISKLSRAVAETREDIAKSSIQGPIFGHVGDGNFHIFMAM